MGKLFSTVRMGTHGRGQQCTSPGVYLTALPLEGEIASTPQGYRPPDGQWATVLLIFRG